MQADIVSQTRIVYHEKELLQLMYDHLVKEGWCHSDSLKFSYVIDYILIRSSVLFKVLDPVTIYYIN